MGGHSLKSLFCHLSSQLMAWQFPECMDPIKKEKEKTFCSFNSPWQILLGKLLQSERDETMANSYTGPSVIWQADLHRHPDPWKTECLLFNLVASRHARNIGCHPHGHLLQVLGIEDSSFPVKCKIYQNVPASYIIKHFPGHCQCLIRLHIYQIVASDY